AMPDLGRGFSPARADCGYRAPLAPRLARPSRWYRAMPPATNDERGRCEHHAITTSAGRPLSPRALGLGSDLTFARGVGVGDALADGDARRERDGWRG